MDKNLLFFSCMFSGISLTSSLFCTSGKDFILCQLYYSLSNKNALFPHHPYEHKNCGKSHPHVSHFWLIDFSAQKINHPRSPHCSKIRNVLVECYIYPLPLYRVKQRVKVTVLSLFFPKQYKGKKWGKPTVVEIYPEIFRQRYATKIRRIKYFLSSCFA